MNQITLNRTVKRELLQIRWLYLRAFPRSERKPFGKILSMVKEGRADLWTIRADGRFAGFAATVNGPELVLLDYFAVEKSLRGTGIGSAALKLFLEQYGSRGVFVEIESTFEATHNNAQRENRKRFYEHCGLIPMYTEADVFGIRMELLGARCHLDYVQYQRFYQEHYSPWAAEHIRPVKEETI